MSSNPRPDGAGSSGAGGSGWTGFRSLKGLFKDTVGNVQELIRSEIDLAMAEIRQEASQAARITSFLALAAACGFLGAGFILLSAVYALSAVMAPWLAALIVGAVVALVAFLLYRMARSRMQKMKMRPEQTIESMKENVRWIRKRTG